jgi:hypothetical protein
MTMRVVNATFYAFKNSPSLKWGYTGRGCLPVSAFDASVDHDERKAEILRCNQDKWPGMSTKADDFFCVVVGDDDVDFGWPLMFRPRAA